MSNGTNAQDRPSLGDAHVALASLLSALKQSGTSTTSSPATTATTNHPASSPAQSSPAYQQPTPQTQPQPPPPPPPSSSNAPTPVDPHHHHHHHHHHHASRPPRSGGQAPTAVELSELGTYELLLQLGAHLGVVGPAHQGGQNQQPQQPQQRPDQLSGSQARQARPTTTVADQQQLPATTASSSSATSHGNMVYKPQPTRSGRMPRVPRPASSAPATAAANNASVNASTINDITKDANPTMSTLLFNDFFDFPSSEDEDDDPDFDPNAPASDFWGDLLARERADGDWTENEDGAMSGTGAGRGGMATRASGESGITSDEFAREIALLTSALNDPLPDLSAHPHHPLPPSSASATAGVRTSPRRSLSSPATSAFEDSPAGMDAQTPPTPPQPPRKRRKTTTVPRRRAALSPVAENETNTTTTTTRRPNVLPAFGEPLASLSPEPEVRPPPSASASASSAGGARSAASGQQQHQSAVSPPLHTLYSLPVPPALNMPPPPTASTTVAVPPPVPAPPPAAAPPPVPAPEKPARKPRRRMFTPEEAAQRRREQAAERMALKRKEDKEKQAAEAVRVKGIEVENAMMRERCRWLEEKCNDLERRLAVATASSPASSQAQPHHHGGANAYATGGHSSIMDQPRGVAMLTPLVGESESDGGEYQVESSEESSSSDGGANSDDDNDDDGHGDADGDGQAGKEQEAGAGAGGDDDAAAADDELTPLATRPSATTTTTSGQDPTVAGAAVNLDLASMGGPALSQLLTLVHAAAHAQGIPLPEGATTGM